MGLSGFAVVLFVVGILMMWKLSPAFAKIIGFGLFVASLIVTFGSPIGGA